MLGLYFDLIAYDLLITIKKRKILIMTSVPSTIKSFLNDLNDWDIFKHINYWTPKLIKEIIFSKLQPENSHTLIARPLRSY